MVQVFLLTRYGVRASRVYLEFGSGAARNERREMFPYDAVASASVTEKGASGERDPAAISLKKREFRLKLVNGEMIAKVTENLTAPKDAVVEDTDDLARLVVQKSGFDSALRVLEAVATEGRDWVTRDRERKQRWVAIGAIAECGDGDANLLSRRDDEDDNLFEEWHVTRASMPCSCCATRHVWRDVPPAHTERAGAKLEQGCVLNLH